MIRPNDSNQVIELLPSTVLLTGATSIIVKKGGNLESRQKRSSRTCFRYYLSAANPRQLQLSTAATNNLEHALLSGISHCRCRKTESRIFDHQSITSMRVVYYWSALLLLVLTMASAEEAKTADAAPEENKTKKGGPKFDATDHTDWGTYYDPKSEFCGKFDCYKILGFDYEEFGKQHPDRKEITQRYRSLSREWHPDKSKHKDAKARFVVS